MYCLIKQRYHLEPHIAKGNKHLLATLRKKYSLFCESQVSWRTDDTDVAWYSDPRSFISRKPVSEQKGVITLLGKQVEGRANDWLFEQLQDHWAVLHKPYDRFRDRYKTYLGNFNTQNGTRRPAQFHKWVFCSNPANLDEAAKQKYDDEIKWQKMDRRVWEVDRVYLDGVLFRTEPSQNMKGTKTDNSVIVGETYTYNRNNQRKQVKEKCYGRIEKFYLHFMYPPSPEELAQAKHKRHIVLSKLQNTPWTVLVKCSWYETVGVNPDNGLTQVQLAPGWNQGCPFIDLTHCLAVNLSLYPSKPFEDQHYDKEGKLKSDINNQQVNLREELHDVVWDKWHD